MRKFDSTQEHQDWLASPGAEHELKLEDPRNPVQRLKTIEGILMDALEGRFGDDPVIDETVQEFIHVYRRMTVDYFFADLYHNGRIEA